MKDNILSTFQLVNKDRVISPLLTTIREYGTWFEKEFDKYTAQQELYMKAKKRDGETVLEWHPGTRIGKWYDNQTTILDVDFQSSYILKDSAMMERLVKLDLAELKDAVPISVNDTEGRQMIRVYTVKQIELYIRNNIDIEFRIAPYIGIPKQIKVKDSDMDKLIMPKIDTQRKRLF